MPNHYFKMKRIILLFFIWLIGSCAFSQLSKQNEQYYQKLFATSVNGELEVVLPDKARVDIVTKTHAIEVDFGPKWAESIGQSLYYANILNKRPGVVLVVSGNYEYRNVNRLLYVAKKYKITVWLLDYRTNTWRLAAK